jgi:hypothetical protein
MRTRSDLEVFKLELERSGLRLPGVILCNCEVNTKKTKKVYAFFHFVDSQTTAPILFNFQSYFFILDLFGLFS